MIIDAHVHAYPDLVIADPKAFAEKHNEHHWKQLVCPAQKKSLQGWASCQDMVDDHANGIVDHQVLLGWYWESREAADLCNHYYGELITAHPSKFSALMSLPLLEDQRVDLAEVSRLLNMGFKGVGEVHLGVQSVDLQDESWLATLQLLEEINLPINFHITESLGRPHAGRVSTPFEDYLSIARQFPNLPIILSHGGASIPFYLQNTYVRQVMKNVYFDTAAIPLLYDLDVVPRIMEIVGHDRVIFGSDFPLQIYPKLSARDGRIKFIEELQSNKRLHRADLFWSHTVSKLLHNSNLTQ